MLRRYIALPTPVHVLCLGTLINRAGTLVIVFLARYIEGSLHLGTTLAGWSLGAYGLGALLASIVGGHLADRIGRRVVMLIALMGGAGVLSIFPMVSTPIGLLVASAMFGLLADMFRPAAAAMLADLVKPADRTHAFGLMYFSINLGVSVAPIAGGYLAEISYDWLFWIDAGTAIAFALIVFFFLPETLIRPRRNIAQDDSAPIDASATDPSAPDASATDASAADATTGESIPFVRAMRIIIADRLFMLYAGATLLVAIVYMQCISTYPLYLSRNGVGAVTYGKLIAINAVMCVLLQLPVTSIISRFDRGRVMAVGAIVIGVGFGLLGTSPTIWIFAFAVIVWTLGELMRAPLTHAIVGDLAPPALRGRYMGIISMSYSTALMIGSPVGGFVLARYGGQYVWYGCFLLAAMAALIYLKIRRQLEPPRDH